MSNLPRLFRILSITAKFRLYEFAEGSRAICCCGCFCCPSLYDICFPETSTGTGTCACALPWRLWARSISNWASYFPPAGIFCRLHWQMNWLRCRTGCPLQRAQGSIADQRTTRPARFRGFQRLDEQPLASASIAQVHCAGCSAARKWWSNSYRPGIEETVRADIRLLKQLATLLAGSSALGRRLHPQEVIADYEVVILNELNLLAEAANTSQLRRNFEHSASLYIPKVYWDFCRTDLIVLERIHGIPVSHTETLIEHQIDLKKLAKEASRFSFSRYSNTTFSTPICTRGTFSLRMTSQTHRNISRLTARSWAH